MVRRGARERLLPPWESIRLRDARDLAPGVVTEALVPASGRRWHLQSTVQECVPERTILLQQTRGPFRQWSHRYEFAPEEDGCRLREQLSYELPYGAVGRVLGSRLQARLERLLDARAQRARADLGRLRDVRTRPRLTIAVSGASGLIGRSLTAFLSSGGHRVLRLVRTPHPTDPDAVRWDPQAGHVDAGIAAADAVIHLAGASIATRWTARARTRIRDSRIQGTRTLAEALARLGDRPRTLLCASAIGWYGDRGEELLAEDAPAGHGFLADVCRDWEQAADAARAAGVRVAHVRIGMVLSGQGGALPPLVRPLRLGLSPTCGDGRQWVSWIALDDLVYLLHHVLHAPSLHGPINAVAPMPIRQRELVAALGKILDRRPRLHVPAALIRTCLGDMGRELLLASTRVVSRVLELETFAYACPDLEQALRWELGRMVFRPTADTSSSHGSWLNS